MAEQQYPQSNTTILLNDSDKALIKNIFSNKLDLILLLRKSLLQGSMTAEEKNLFVNFSKELIAVLRKQFLPKINFDNPAAQLLDLWNLNIKNKILDYAWIEIESRRLMIDYLEERFNFLEGNGEGKIKLSDLEYNKSKPKEKAFIELLARNDIIFHIDQNMGILWATANQQEKPEELSEEEKKKRKSTK